MPCVQEKKFCYIRRYNGGCLQLLWIVSEVNRRVEYLEYHPGNLYAEILLH